MTTFPNRWVYRSLSLLVLLPLQACALPLTYSTKPIQGYVVDANTRAPIEGAVVVAAWKPMGPGGSTVCSLQIIETVTDKDGRYAIPGWGPKLRPLGAELITHRDPELTVFKSSYVAEFLYNERERNTSVPVSDWHGKTIPLKPFRGTQEKRIDQLTSLIGRGLNICLEVPGADLTSVVSRNWLYMDGGILPSGRPSIRRRGRAATQDERFLLDVTKLFHRSPRVGPVL